MAWAAEALGGIDLMGAGRDAGLLGHEHDPEPAEDVVDYRRGLTDVPVRSPSGWFELLMLKFPDDRLERHAVLQRKTSQNSDRIHEPRHSASLLCHFDKEFPWLSVFVKANRDVPLVTMYAELVRH